MTELIILTQSIQHSCSLLVTHAYKQLQFFFLVFLIVSLFNFSSLEQKKSAMTTSACINAIW